MPETRSRESLRIRGAGILDHDPSWHWISSGADNLEYVFWAIAGGHGTLVAGPDTIRLERGVCIVSPLCEAHEGTQLPTDLLRIPWVVFECLDSSFASTPRPLRKLPRVRTLGDVELMLTLLERAVDAFHAGGHSASDAAVWTAAALAEARRVDRTPVVSASQTQRSASIDQLAHTIRRDPGAPYTLESMASAAACTPDHLVRLFHRYRGVTPIEYVLRCRMEFAQHQLLFSGQAVGRIAEEAGFSDQSYFTRVFTRRVGVPPTVFRRQTGSR